MEPSPQTRAQIEFIFKTFSRHLGRHLWNNNKAAPIALSVDRVDLHTVTL